MYTEDQRLMLKSHKRAKKKAKHNEEKLINNLSDARTELQRDPNDGDKIKVLGEAWRESGPGL